ncbi:ArpU family phage packaging/lysis transcriptional regulator [Companilactobacillus keshanensis]|uniref:ArpU family phage packaging/lysis transcriptional regulator n=1 Tax=Companilactobacillus keshanensis TaxID=2486003 RepID=A0ABW4BVE5_9LACO|nr:ArpU family phage packaging/lysis transcriptional regulator [Companilactobacillus keshanensis]
MFLLPEYDEIKCRNNVRPILKRYRRMARIAGRPLTDLRSPIISDMPRSLSFDNNQEKENSISVSAKMEVDEINRAVKNLSQECFAVIYYTYLSKEEYTNLEIASIVFGTINANKTVERRQKDGLLQFCESYRHGQLLVYKDRNQSSVL